MNLKEKMIPLKNAVGDYNHVRNSLLPSLLKNLSENQHQEYPQNIFEMGRTFALGNTETGVVEKEKLAVMVCHEKADFTEIRQIVDALMNAVGLKLSIKESKHSSFMEGRIGDIFVKGTKIGIIGELHPQILTNWKIETPVVGLELDIKKVFQLTR